MKKALMFLLTAAVLAGVFACAGTEGNPDELLTETGAAAETTGDLYDEWGREIIPSSLPEGLDFEGENVVFYVLGDGSAASGSREFFTEDDTAESVNDLVYTRNEKVMNDLGVNLVFFAEGDANVINKNVAATYLAASGDYDVITNYAYYGVSTALSSCYSNLYGLPYLDLDQPWWSQNYIRNAETYGQLYYIVGSLNLNMIDRTLAVFFNEKLTENYGLPADDLYDVALTGKWTVSRLAEYTKDRNIDLDSDNKINLNDFIGFTSSEGGTGMQGSFDIRFVTVNDDGSHTLDLDIEKLASVIDIWIDLLYNSNGAYIPSIYGSDDALAMFTNEQALFCMNNLFRSGTANAKLRAMTSNYGILPMPKYDEDQANYYSWVQDAYNLMSVMGSIKNPEAVGAALESMCYETYRKVYPTYTELIMKYKYLRDENSTQVFDLVVNGINFNFLEIYSQTLGDVTNNLVREIINTKNNTLASKYEKNVKQWQTKLDKVDEFYAELAKG
ncbi:MAG: hypothetical protein ACYCWE_02975 [Eubacteriales bacterium]